jgi:hypothetical protein
MTVIVLTGALGTNREKSQQVTGLLTK